MSTPHPAPASAANPLRAAFARKHPDELAAWLAQRPHEELMATLGALPPDAAAAVTAKLPHRVSMKVLAGHDDAQACAWLVNAALDDALTLVLHLEQQRRAQVLAMLPDRHMRRTLERLTVYPQKTVGALIDPTVVRLAAGTRLDEAIDILRAGAYREQEWIWIVDGEGRYAGLLDLSKALLMRSNQCPVGELAVHLEPLRAETALAAARDVSEWMTHPELPVVDHLNHLLGALSRQRLMEALRDQAPEPYGVLDGVTSLTYQYFRVMGVCIGDLLGFRRSR